MRSSSSELGPAAEAFWGFWAGSKRKGEGKVVEGVLVVPLRARDWALGLCPELSTAAARWRPAGARCCMARQGRHSAKAKSGGGGQARRWAPREQEVAGLALHGGIGADQRRRQEKQIGRLEVEEKGPVCNFQNFRDLTVNRR